jgi:F420-non-reducing hydrogenase small subunit
MPDKPKVAFYWCGSCGGCEESIVDLAEDILTVIENVDIVLWPVAMDFKKEDVMKMPDKSIVASLINGAIRTSEHEEMVKMLRKKSVYIIAHGSCASTGGIPGLANQFKREDILKYVYEDCPTNQNSEKNYPTPIYKENGFDLTVPVFRNMVRSLDQVIDVDYYLPGCPPTPKIIKDAVFALLENKLPPKGTVLSPDIALCNECPRRDTKPTDLTIKEFKRPHLTEMKPDLCLLAQGILCMGPATRSGCEALCIKGNMPCSGCFGGTSRVKDYGAKILSSIAATVAAKTEKEIDETLAGIPDPVGTFYRYGLPKSLLRRKVDV